MRNRFDEWMLPGEFPVERIERVKTFIRDHGVETGMDFEWEGDECTFTRRRIMILARRAA